MDYEKKHKESLEMANEYHFDGTKQRIIDTIEYFLPEPKKSEDERIRKDIIKTIERHIEYVFQDESYAPDAKDFLIKELKGQIAWLERQDEQNPTDKVEPKFKVGNWYQCTKDFFGKGVTFDKNTAYYCAKEGCLQCEYGCHIAIVKDLYDNFKLWTIQDAKGGDVLCDGTTIFIFKDLLSDGSVMSYCDYDTDSSESDAFCSLSMNLMCSKITPATKEQSDILFQKMKEAGYEWDVDKKELNEIHNALEECEIENIEHGKYYYCIKDYFCGGKKQASKGDVVQALRGMSIMGLGVKANEYFLPVNSIKQKSAWSEEDEYTLYETIKHLEELIIIDKSKHCGVDVQYYQRDIDWLKSLKDRVQSQWKPSDEQLDALHDAAVYVDKSMFPHPKGILMKMYKQLNKLRKE